MKNQIYITVEGGLVYDVAVSRDLIKRGVRVTLIDFDTDGVFEQELGKACGDEALISDFPISSIEESNFEIEWPKTQKEKSYED